MLRFLVVFFLLISLGLGCNADDPLIPEAVDPFEDVTYPGAPIISIRKTSEDPLILRLEAKESLPYDIKVKLVFKGTFKEVSGQINALTFRINMQTGRQVRGFSPRRNVANIKKFRNFTLDSLIYSILEWEGIGDAPYNVGNPHTVTIKANQE